MANKSLALVVNTCLDHAEQLPLARRVELYRGLADICGCPHEAASYEAMARDLEQADHRCREFAFRMMKGGQS